MTQGRLDDENQNNRALVAENTVSVSYFCDAALIVTLLQRKIFFLI